MHPFVPRNQLLRDLPTAEWHSIARYLRQVQLHRGEVLVEMDERATDIYFPESGCVGGVVLTSEGSSIGGIIAGRSDAVGGDFLGPTPSPWRLLTIEPGMASAITVEQLGLALDEIPELLTRLVRHSSYLTQAAALSIACARFHLLQARLARLLLNTQDLIDADALRLTHEQLALLLGSYRPTVTGAARALEASGAIRQRRARIEVVNRARLEAESCDCYARLASRRRELLGWSTAVA